jgi:hypothetical protein
VAVHEQVQLGPRLATIDGICANVVPRVWRARSWCQGSPATSPSGLGRPAGPGAGRAAVRTRRRCSIRPGGDGPSPPSRSQAHRPAAAARGSRSEPCTPSRRSSGDRGRSGSGRRTKDEARVVAAARGSLTTRQGQGSQPGSSS